MADLESFHAETVEGWSAWLEANHDSSPGVWLVGWRSATGRPSVGYDDAVCEALRFGWIDSTVRKLDEERTAQRYTPRRKGSMWSRPNKRRIARLEREGRLEEAGRRVIDAAKADGSWRILDDVEDLIVPADLTAAFRRHVGATKAWRSFPAGARKQMLTWIATAKRPETRSKRIEEIAAKAASGERAKG